MQADNITLKDDFTFLISDETGNVISGPEGQGMYLRDTRYLSRLELSINGEQPETLSFTADYNIAATFRLSTSMRAQLEEHDSHLAPPWTIVAHAIGIARRRYIRRGIIETLELTNYHTRPVQVTLTLRVGADFADVFEVRGFPLSAFPHTVQVDEADGGRIIDFYSIPTEGSASPRRHLRFSCDIQPSRIDREQVESFIYHTPMPEVTLHYELELQPHKPLVLHPSILPEPDEQGVYQHDSTERKSGFIQEVAEMRAVFDKWQESCTQVETPDYVLGRILETSTVDLRSLMQKGEHGLVVTAGIPWYFTLFGRDSLITSLQTLSLNPQIAIDTLRSLAAYQGTDLDNWRDSEPGKVLHELRVGDMTFNNEVPHSPYYGSVDSTLLFILLFAETLKWTGDEAFFHELWPNVERALDWAERYGDLDGDGYIEFERRSERGILHQGWKDSDESMGGAVGPRPEAPIALVEVQGYLYAAQRELAGALRRYGNEEQHALAERLTEQADRLKAKFNKDFWWEEEHFFAQALDGKKQQVRNVTSNVGHCLWTGIVDATKAASVVERLMRSDMLCGWGVRTMSTLDPTYNPMSYHNGSVWPHDNALLVAGLRRYGFHAESLRLAAQILDAAATFPDGRLPELYCGFPRGGAEDRAPAAYPVSCSPQAWAAGTPVLILQSLLGLEADAHRGTISLSPVLPPGTDSLTLRGLNVGGKCIGFYLRRDQATGQIILADAGEPESEADGITISLRP